MQEAAPSSAAERLSRILASLSDTGGNSSKQQSAAVIENRPQLPVSSTEGVLPQRHSTQTTGSSSVRQAHKVTSNQVKYSESVASALAFASEIERSMSSPQKSVALLSPSSTPASSSAAAVPVAPAAPPTTSSSVVRVRSGHIVSREKNIDSSLVRCASHRNHKPPQLPRDLPPPPHPPASSNVTSKPNWRRTKRRARVWRGKSTSYCT